MAAPSPSPSLADLLHSATTDDRPKVDQGSTPSTSRRSSDRTPSTKPASPISVRQNCKLADVSTPSILTESSLPSPSPKPSSPPSFPPNLLTSSQSHNTICKAPQAVLKKSQSTSLNSQGSQISSTKPMNLQSPLLPISHPPAARIVPTVQVPVPLVRQEAIENDSSSVLSDDTSSMSSTSLSIPDTNLIL